MKPTKGKEYHVKAGYYEVDEEMHIKFTGESCKIYDDQDQIVETFLNPSNATYVLQKGYSCTLLHGSIKFT